MKDLTQHSIAQHIIHMAAPIAAGMTVQVLYQLIDLYFVSGLGDAAIAGVSTAGTAAYVVFALTRVLGVGTTAVISHAVGRKDRADANLMYNQSLVMSALCGVVVLVSGYLFIRFYLHSVAADKATIDAGTTYMYWMMPGLALQFALTTMVSALGATGIVKPAMFVQMFSVVMNTILAPILIAGWGTQHPLGVAGAGLATSISVAAGVLVLWVYFHRLEHYIAINRKLQRPQWRYWNRILQVGLPSGGEIAVMFVYTAITYYVIRHFGAAAQAGFGIGSRILQAVMLPAMAVAFAAAPIAGQNFGARNGPRVSETFRQAALIGSVVMLIPTIFGQWRPEYFVGLFTKDPQARAVGTLYVHLISWTFVAQGLIFTCSSMFQGLGNTRPSLLSSVSRLVTYGIPAIWLSGRMGFRLEYAWYLAIATVALQVSVSLLLLRREFHKRLPPLEKAPLAERATAS